MEQINKIDRHAIYRENNRELLRERAKDYYLIHKDEIKEKKKIYHDNHREEILTKNKERVKCECGAEINKSELSRHLKTSSHEKKMNRECECGCKMIWKDFLITKKHIDINKITDI